MVEQFFTAEQSGLTRAQLRWGEAQGRWRRIDRTVYRRGAHDPTLTERSIALVLAVDGVASGEFAGVWLGLDAVRLRRPEATVGAGLNNRRGVRRRDLAPERIITVRGLPCTDGLQTMVDLAAALDDLRWEQALESALRLNLTTVAAIDDALPALGRARTPGVRKMRGMLALRPAGAPPTESLLETLAVQLVRAIGLPEPTRQLVVWDDHGVFVARVDLCWPELGLFLELDGQQHAGQPVYDANRETAVVATTGWLCGRFTWTEIVHHPVATGRRIAALIDQARRRPVRAA